MLQNHARKNSYVKTVTNRMCKQLKISILKIGRPLSGNISPFPVVGANTHFEKNFAALWGAFVEKGGYVWVNKKSCPFWEQLYFVSLKLKVEG
jgi:hypothetical protein